MKAQQNTKISNVFGQEYGIISSDMDDSNRYSADLQNHPDLFRSNKESFLKAREQFKTLDKKRRQIVKSAHIKDDDKSLLESIKEYYDSGRETMLKLGSAIRVNEDSALHAFIVGFNSDVHVDLAIYEERKRQHSICHARPETLKGEALMVISEFEDAKDHLEKVNQFQMLESLKNSVCAAHWALQRYMPTTSFNYVNKAPKL